MITLTKDDRFLINNNAAIIDDDIFEEKSSALSIAKVLSDYGTTFIKEDCLPKKNKWDNFLSMSFIILDWDLKNKGVNELPEGVQLGTSLISESKSNIIDFIKHIITKSLTPIFIITQENTQLINDSLNKDAKIKDAILKNNIVIGRKQELKGVKIIRFLQKWIKSNNSNKVLKRLENNICEAKNKLFIEMDSVEKEWIDVVKDTIDKDDPEDPELELSQFIINVFLSRLSDIDFSEINFKKRKKISKETLIKVYSTTKVCAYDTSVISGQHTGDIYVQKFEDGKSEGELYINVTAECDTRKKHMFLVKCTREYRKNLKLSLNSVIDHVDKFTIPMILNEEAVVCKLGTVEKIKKTSNLNEIEVKNKKYIRVGRLIHPYTTALRKKIAEYFSRQGLPVHPMKRL